MAEMITKVKIEKTGIIQQCDVIKNVELIEYVIEDEESIEVAKIHFPYVVVLSQACDLLQDYNAKMRIKEHGEGNQDKYLISVIVAPLYNFQDFLSGVHLQQLNMVMSCFPSRRDKTNTKNLIENENKRYHYLKFEENIPLVESIIDFKHYFTVTVSYLNKLYDTNYVCSIDDLYREQISQRFSFFLSRIGLPD